MTNDLTDDALEMVAERFKLLSEPMRLRLLNLLRDRAMTVTELVTSTGATQANISKHLGLLYQQGLVSRQKDGLFVYYRIESPEIFELCDIVCSSLSQKLKQRQQSLPPR